MCCDCAHRPLQDITEILDETDHDAESTSGVSLVVSVQIRELVERTMTFDIY